MASARVEILSRLGDLICAVECLSDGPPHPLRVAIDGVDAAGKTSLAEELVPLIENRGRQVIRASIDGFHNPRAVRYQRGVNSPEGYYRDSFNSEALLRELLIPLGPGGNRHYSRAVFDYQVDAPIFEPALVAPANAVLLFDGVFLLRSELVDHWDFSIYVEVDFDISVPRAVARDVAHNQGLLDSQSILAKYNQRYLPGQKIYFAEASPKEKADVIVINNDLENPGLIVL